MRVNHWITRAVHELDKKSAGNEEFERLKSSTLSIKHVTHIYSFVFSPPPIHIANIFFIIHCTKWFLIDK